MKEKETLLGTTFLNKKKGEKRILYLELEYKKAKGTDSKRF